MATAAKKAPKPRAPLKNNHRGGRGGARPGAGRKPNTPNKATQERQKRIAESGVTPLEVMIENMRWAHQGAAQLLTKLSRLKRVGDETIVLIRELEKMRGIAQECAKDAAPYVHPKLQSVLHGQDPDRKATEIKVTVDEEALARVGDKILRNLWSNPG